VDTSWDGICQAAYEACYGGCTYPDADNYDSTALADDGSCFYGCPEDLDGDGLVNTTDLLQFLGQFGTACP
ncbi:MAG: hypothetical protein HKN32_03120, partial [Flavobacteriales bacterium]|nr:hypothetical protein [Flavobacteriales bacterium]